MQRIGLSSDYTILENMTAPLIFDDIDEFVALLTGGHEAVREPSSVALAVATSLAAAFWSVCHQ